MRSVIDDGDNDESWRPVVPPEVRLCKDGDADDEWDADLHVEQRTYETFGAFLRRVTMEEGRENKADAFDKLTTEITKILRTALTRTALQGEGHVLLTFEKTAPPTLRQDALYFQLDPTTCLVKHLKTNHNNRVALLDALEYYAKYQDCKVFLASPWGHFSTDKLRVVVVWDGEDKALLKRMSEDYLIFMPIAQALKKYKDQLFCRYLCESENAHTTFFQRQMETPYVSTTTWLTTMQDATIMSTLVPMLDTLTLIRLLSAVCHPLRARFAASHAAARYLDSDPTITTSDKRSAVKRGVEWRNLFDFPTRLKRDFMVQYADNNKRSALRSFLDLTARATAIPVWRKGGRFHCFTCHKTRSLNMMLSQRLSPVAKCTHCYLRQYERYKELPCSVSGMIKVVTSIILDRLNENGITVVTYHNIVGDIPETVGTYAVKERHDPVDSRMTQFKQPSLYGDCKSHIFTKNDNTVYIWQRSIIKEEVSRVIGRIEAHLNDCIAAADAAANNSSMNSSRSAKESESKRLKVCNE